jgi:hypothetical protein
MKEEPMEYVIPDIPELHQRVLDRLLAASADGSEGLTTDELAAAVGLPPTRENVEIRRVLRELIEYGIPVCSGRRGFHMPSDPADVDRTTTSLRGRIHQIELRVLSLERAKDQWFHNN